jgi:hypothetical protein
VLVVLTVDLFASSNGFRTRVLQAGAGRLQSALQRCRARAKAFPVMLGDRNYNLPRISPVPAVTVVALKETRPTAFTVITALYPLWNLILVSIAVAKPAVFTRIPISGFVGFY